MKRTLLIASAFVMMCVAGQAQEKAFDLVARTDGPRIIAQADLFLQTAPQTVTAFPAPCSAGGPHDFYSEGDYWWPDPAHPEGPYVQRDGLTNPHNFVAHRRAMVEFSQAVATLTAAYRITHDSKYARHAVRHLRAWFEVDSTMMNPNLLYAQAIRNKVTGRGIGIIDTIHLIEIARAVEILSEMGALPSEDAAAIRSWFAKYVEWMTTHRYGLDERAAKNNHGTWWVAQVAAFARASGDTARMDLCRERFRTVLVPDQMAADGSFPLELSRTKPYNYSIFNLEGFTLICRILSTPSDDLWHFTLPDGRGLARAMSFMVPYMSDKSRWPFPPDVLHFEDLPGRPACLLLAGLALPEPRDVALWRSLDPTMKSEEMLRNTAVKQPLLWIDEEE